MKIGCGFCGKMIEIEEYDYARICKGELIWCEECYEEFREGKSVTRRA